MHNFHARSFSKHVMTVINVNISYVKIAAPISNYIYVIKNGYKPHIQAVFDLDSDLELLRLLNICFLIISDIFWNSARIHEHVALYCC